MRPVCLPKYCRFYPACNGVVNGSLQTTSIQSHVTLLDKGWKGGTGKYAENMVIREEFYITVIIEEACQTEAMTLFCLLFCLENTKRNGNILEVRLKSCYLRKLELNLRGASAFKHIAVLCNLEK